MLENCLKKGRRWSKRCVYIATTVLAMQKENLIMMVGDDDVVVDNYGTWWIQIDQATLSVTSNFWGLNISHMVGLASFYM